MKGRSGQCEAHSAGSLSDARICRGWQYASHDLDVTCRTSSMGHPHVQPILRTSKVCLLLNRPRLMPFLSVVPGHRHFNAADPKKEAEEHSTPSLVCHSPCSAHHDMRMLVLQCTFAWRISKSRVSNEACSQISGECKSKYTGKQARPLKPQNTTGQSHWMNFCTRNEICQAYTNILAVDQ